MPDSADSDRAGHRAWDTKNAYYGRIIQSNELFIIINIVINININFIINGVTCIPQTVILLTSELDEAELTRKIYGRCITNTEAARPKNAHSLRE